MAGEEEPSVLSDDTAVLLSDKVGQLGTGDLAGNLIITGDTTATITGDTLTEFVLYGVFNGSFSAGPPQGAGSTISAENPLHFWTGPVSVSGGAITCSWVADSASPSDHNLRFNIAAGAAGDEAYVEQIVPIGGSRSRQLGNLFRADFYRVTATATFRVYIALQYLTASSATTGASLELTRDATVDATVYTIAQFANSTTASPPSDARLLRIRAGVRRAGGAGAADTATLDLANVRQEVARPFLLVAEGTTPASFAASVIDQSNGEVFINAGGSDHAASDVSLSVAVATGTTVKAAAGTVAALRLTEQAAPVTPASSYLAVYADSSGFLHALNDAGTNFQLAPLGAAYYCSDITLPAAGAQAIEVVSANVSGTPSGGAVVFPFAGSVIGIGVRLTAARTGGTCAFQAYDVTAGAAIGPTATINATDTQTAYASGAVGAVGSTFAAGARLRVQATGAGTFAPTTADCIVTVLVALTLT